MKSNGIVRHGGLSTKIDSKSTSSGRAAETGPASSKKPGQGARSVMNEKPVSFVRESRQDQGRSARTEGLEAVSNRRLEEKKSASRPDRYDPQVRLGKTASRPAGRVKEPIAFPPAANVNKAMQLKPSANPNETNGRREEEQTQKRSTSQSRRDLSQADLSDRASSFSKGDDRREEEQTQKRSTRQSRASNEKGTGSARHRAGHSSMGGRVDGSQYGDSPSRRPDEHSSATKQRRDATSEDRGAVSRRPDLSPDSE